VALFDRYVVVDWSASARPHRGANSIWTCEMAARSTEIRLDNHATRDSARRHLIDVLAVRSDRVLVGFDFAFGYPAGFARAAGLEGAPAWRSTWRHLVGALDDRPDNTNNRFEVAAALNERVGPGPGPFWGTAGGRPGTEHLSPTRAPGFPHRGLAEHRLSERAFRSTGRRPSSVWQLTGAGSVGSQTITGIPTVHELRHHASLAHRATVWPFETGLRVDPTGGRPDAIVLAEVWPSAVAVDRQSHPVRDAAQVTGLCRHLADVDARGLLGIHFAPVLEGAEERAVLDEEGWIVGAPHPHRAGRSPA
jgi:precorrin-8X/cobalt-precorrin-8 methylmutase